MTTLKAEVGDTLYSKKLSEACVVTGVDAFGIVLLTERRHTIKEHELKKEHYHRTHELFFLKACAQQRSFRKRLDGSDFYTAAIRLACKLAHACVMKMTEGALTATLCRRKKQSVELWRGAVHELGKNARILRVTDDTIMVDLTETGQTDDYQSNV